MLQTNGSIGQNCPPDALIYPRIIPYFSQVQEFKFLPRQGLLMPCTVPEALMTIMSPITKLLDTEQAKAHVLCLSSYAQSCVCLCPLHMESYSHTHTRPETSAIIYDMLYSIERDIEVQHPLICCHTFKSRLNEVKSKQILSPCKLTGQAEWIN